MTSKPHYPGAQACEACHFLGHFNGRWEDYDLYACVEKDGTLNTIIARYGPQGGDYLSGVVFGQKDLLNGPPGPLGEALRLSLAAGYRLSALDEESGREMAARYNRIDSAYAKARKQHEESKGEQG